MIHADSYKYSHPLQYPPGTQKVFSFLEARRGAEFPETMFFGLQYYLKKHFLDRITKEDVDAEENLMRIHMPDSGFYRKGWDRIIDKHNGRLPLKIRAVPEGTVVPIDNVLMTIENTDEEETWWLTNFAETMLQHVWYPSTVATVSFTAKKLFKKYFEKTADSMDALPFMLHDFGMRGVSGLEQAGIGGLAHLVNFMGTDTTEALRCGIRYYNSGVCGFSVPATEHSTMTSWGRDNEVGANENMLNLYPTGLVSVVGDSYDTYHAAKVIWGELLKEKILSRDGKAVFRPDSGDPVEVVIRLIRILDEKFGSSTNSKGYKVLNPKVGLIQGDGLDLFKINSILEALTDEGWSAESCVMGMGGGLLQKLNRDTQRISIKCSQIQINGELRDVIKDPKTDQSKKSKSGQLKLVREDGKFETRTLDQPGEDVLRTVYEDGELLEIDTFDDVRRRAESFV